MTHVHFIGIGGAGTSGLAELLLSRGIRVSGSDMASSSKTDELVKHGANIYAGHEASNISEDVDLVVYSSAVKNSGNPELGEAERRGIKALRRAEFMGELVRDLRTIGVAGTHGKTTTSSMIASILIEAKLDPTVIIGASVKELDGRNARAGLGDIAVVEADEYDRSFLALEPYIAVITSLEAEHLDIYSDIDDLKATFVQFANQKRESEQEGFVVLCIDEPHLREITTKLDKKIVSYGLTSSEAKYRATGIDQKGQKTRMTIVRGGESLGELELGVPGEHNVKNALAAIAVADILSIPFEATRKALKKFQGADRRFQLKGEADGILVIDDYAHHPTEIEATLATVRKAYSGRRILACFQPHTFTRTRDFAVEFGTSLASGSDMIFLLDIYPARERPIEGVSSQKILDSAISAGARNAIIVSSLESLPETVVSVSQPGDVILTIGAGTITEAAPRILELITQRELRVSPQPRIQTKAAI